VTERKDRSHAGLKPGSPTPSQSLGVAACGPATAGGDGVPLASWTNEFGIEGRLKPTGEGEVNARLNRPTRSSVRDAKPGARTMCRLNPAYPRVEDRTSACCKRLGRHVVRGERLIKPGDRSFFAKEVLALPPWIRPG